MLTIYLFVPLFYDLLIRSFGLQNHAHDLLIRSLVLQFITFVPLFYDLLIRSLVLRFTNSFPCYTIY